MSERKHPRWIRILLIVLATPVAVVLVLVAFLFVLVVVANLFGPPKPRDAASLARAIISGHTKQAIQAIEAGVDVRGDSEFFGTPLHAAARGGGRIPITDGSALVTGSEKLVKLLLAKGADPGARDRNGATPLHKAAATRENAGVIGLLLDAGADPNARDAGRMTPLHWAAIYNPEALPLLLKKGALPNAEDDGGDRPLHFAPTSRNVTAVKALVAAGANVNARNKAGQTPLHKAAYISGNAAAIESLIEKGADVNASDQTGCHPIDYAERQGYPDIAKLLESRGGRRGVPPT